VQIVNVKVDGLAAHPILEDLPSLRQLAGNVKEKGQRFARGVRLRLERKNLSKLTDGILISAQFEVSKGQRRKNGR